MLKLFIYIVVFSININLYAALPQCGDHESDDRNLNWVLLTDINVDAKIQNVKGVLCVGLKPGDQRIVDSVIYRDDTGTFKNYKLKDLISGPQVLITDKDLNIGIIRKGPIMTLYVGDINETEDSIIYDIKLRFLRNLAKIPFKGPDYKELSFSLKNIYQKNDIFPYYSGDTKRNFNQFNIYISIALNIHKIILSDFENIQAQIKTSVLRSIDSL
jgi:hypothetical protein